MARESPRGLQRSGTGEVGLHGEGTHAAGRRRQLSRGSRDIHATWSFRVECFR